MKYLVSLTLFLATAAKAAEIVPLETPRNPLGAIQPGYCTANPNPYNANGTFAGTCQYPYGNAPKYAHQATKFFVVTWDINGTATLGELCGSTNVYLRPEDEVFTPAPGYSGFCALYPGTGSYMVLDGVQGYYVASNSTSELLTYVKHTTLITF